MNNYELNVRITQQTSKQTNKIFILFYLNQAETDGSNYITLAAGFVCVFSLFTKYKK